jgi:hypothetical protein
MTIRKIPEERILFSKSLTRSVAGPMQSAEALLSLRAEPTETWIKLGLGKSTCGNGWRHAGPEPVTVPFVIDNTALFINGGIA